MGRESLDYKAIQYQLKQIGSYSSRSKSSSIVMVMAIWKSDFFGQPLDFDEIPSDLLSAARVS